MAKSRRRWTLLLTVVVTLFISVPAAVWAGHQFTDVPNSHIFHTGISWMKDNNITVGCNPPANTQYCPEDNVTRGEMATFMKRLAENKVVDAANSDALGGFSAAELGSRAAFASDGNLPNENTTLVANIDAPARGILVINGVVDVTTGAAANTVICSLLVDGTMVTGTQMFTEVAPSAERPIESVCATTGAVAVDPGSHEVTLNITGVVTASLWDSSVNVIWVPFDGSGSTPAALTPLGGSESPDKSADD